MVQKWYKAVERPKGRLSAVAVRKIMAEGGKTVSEADDLANCDAGYDSRTGDSSSGSEQFLLPDHSGEALVLKARLGVWDFNFTYYSDHL